MNKGDVLTANWSETLVDHVTKGKQYEVVEASRVGFYIINNKGEKTFPIATSFKKISETERIT